MVMKKLFTLIFLSLLTIPVLSQVDRKVIVEHFTNTRCSVCASKNPALFELLDDHPEVLHVAFHPSSPYSNCIFSEHNPVENDARTNYYGIYGGTPRVVLQGDVIGFQTPILTQQQLEAQLGMMSDYSITVQQEEQDGGEVDVTIEIEKVSGSSDNLNLYAVIVEEFIDYTSPNGEDGHHNVFRRVLADEVVSLPSAGNSITVEKTYALDPQWGETQMYVLAILQETSTNDILQAERSENLTGGPSFISESAGNKIDNLFFPNPAKDIVRINPEYDERFISARVYNIYGQFIGSYAFEDEIDLANLDPGQYIILLTDKSGDRIYTRIVKL